MPESTAFSKKLKNLIELFSKNGDSISETSTNFRDKKSDEDNISDDDSECELLRDVYPNEEDRNTTKISKGNDGRLKSKTPLGDMLNSLLRKKSSLQMFEESETYLENDIRCTNESSTFVTSPVLISNNIDLSPWSADEGNADDNDNEPNLELSQRSFDGSSNFASSVGKLGCTGSTAKYHPQNIDVHDAHTIPETCRTSIHGNSTDDS